MYHPWRHLRGLWDHGRGTFLSFEETPNDRDAWYSPDADTILMRPDLSQVDRRCALAHELAHRDLGHSGQCQHGDARSGRRDEAAADELAARRLIPLHDFIEALCWSDDEGQIAEELWVTVEMLQVRARTMLGGEQEIVRVELVARGLG